MGRLPHQLFVVSLHFPWHSRILCLQSTDLGDWGKQYGLLALAFELYGNEEELQKDPIDHLYQLYVRINKEKDAEIEEIEALKKEGKDASELEAKSKDEQARQYFKRMVRCNHLDRLVTGANLG